jgi:hypothetical protein
MSHASELASFRAACSGAPDPYHRARTERADDLALLLAAITVVVAGCAGSAPDPTPPHDYLRNTHTPGQVTR